MPTMKKRPTPLAKTTFPRRSRTSSIITPWIGDWSRRSRRSCVPARTRQNQYNTPLRLSEQPRPRPTMKYLLFIALGGASGAVSRYLLANWVHSLWEGKLPMGTLLVNMVGSFAIGVVYVLLVERQLIHADWRGVLMVGFLGAFTTFSTFSLETISLLEAGHVVHALAYMLGSAVLCVVMAGLAIQLTRVLA